MKITTDKNGNTVWDLIGPRGVDPIAEDNYDEDCDCPVCAKNWRVKGGPKKISVQLPGGRPQWKTPCHTTK